MSKTEVSLSILIGNALESIKQMGMKESTMRYYRGKFSCIIKYFTDCGNDHYDAETMARFLKESGKRLEEGKISAGRYRALRKACHILTELNSTGAATWKREQLPKIELNAEFEKLLNELVESAGVELSKNSVIQLRSFTRKYLKYLDDLGHESVETITINDLKQYVMTHMSAYPGSKARFIGNLRRFHKYLRETELKDIQFESVLLKPAGDIKRVPVAFSKDEAKEILKQVDCEDKMGKRDYAILSLAVNTGLRSTDICNLRLRDINWHSNEICITQQKTRKSLYLPLPVSVGCVVAEYILNARPEVGDDHIFLRNEAPFKRLGHTALAAIFNRYQALSSVDKEPGDGKSFRAFRRSLGSWMVQDNVPLTMVSQIYGHRNMNSAKPYLSLNSESLKICSLSLSGIVVTKEALL